MGWKGFLRLRNLGLLPPPISLSSRQDSAVCFTYFSSPIQSAKHSQMIAPPTSGVCPIKGLGKQGPLLVFVQPSWFPIQLAGLSHSPVSPIQSAELS